MGGKWIARLDCIMLVLTIMLGTGCEMPWDKASSPTGTTGTSGETVSVNVGGSWEGTYNETCRYNPSSNLAVSGLVYLTIAQTNNTFTGTGYSQANGSSGQYAFNFSNGVINGNDISFTIMETSEWYDNGSKWTMQGTNQITGEINGNVMTGNFKRTATVTSCSGYQYIESAEGVFSVTKK